MASVPFWILAAACAASYLATPLKRGRSFVRRPFLAAANEKTGSLLDGSRGASLKVTPPNPPQGQPRLPSSSETKGEL